MHIFFISKEDKREKTQRRTADCNMNNQNSCICIFAVGVYFSDNYNKHITVYCAFIKPHQLKLKTFS